MIWKALVIAIFLGIVASLGSALMFLMRDRGSTDRMAKALTLRVGVSIALFILLLLLGWLGYITPHGIRP